LVIGGSLGGLMAALALRGVGCDVDIYERVPQRLVGNGAGLRIVPEMAQLLEQRAGIDLSEVSTFTTRFRHIGDGNRILAEKLSPGQFTSWGSLHRALALGFDPKRCHLGAFCEALTQRAGGIEVHFANGRTERADLVVFADGILSTGRHLLAPDAELSYAGYVGWRGFVPQADLSPATWDLFSDAVSYGLAPYSHVSVYPIPDPTTERRDARAVNFVWYRNVATGADFDALMTDRTGIIRMISLSAGAVREEFIAAVKADARQLMPPAVAEVINKTAEPFLQALYDLTLPRMAYGRACLIGDAAFVSRPHAGAATTKAAVNAWHLADCLVAADGNVDAALKAWEPSQVELGRSFVERNRWMGSISLVENRFNPTDPDHLPGLRGPGR
jgi:2,6-dihydroxypyridine 3-monooxygenase